MGIFKDLYKYRELLKTSIKKDIGGKYKHSFLGVIWSFLNPLLQIAVYAIIFPMIMKNNMENYTVFMVCGLIPWNFFVTAVNRSSFTIIENGNIIKKVYFPREILPISLVTSEAINFLISSIIILVFTLANGISLTWTVVLYPIILVVQYVVILAISFIVSSVTVYFRDLQHFLGIFLQLLFYATPIVYSINVIPANFQWILKLNPMTYIIDAYRAIFYNTTLPDMRVLAIVFIIGILAVILGYMIFNKLQKKFAEEL